MLLRTFLASLLFLFAFPATACGPDSDCQLGERSYRIALPEGNEPIRGAVIYAHGYRGSAAGAMRNKGLIKSLNERGLAYIAAQGVQGTWNLPNRPGRGSNEAGLALEVAYFRALKAKMVEGHGVPADNIMFSGFSAGGMVSWQMACTLGDEFAAYAPFAGTFWAPVPKACDGLPVPLIHSHGTSDKTVPLKGRRIGDTAQGDVYRALKLMAKAGNYGKWRSIGTRGDLTCQQREGKGANILQLCLHDGGHTFRSEWLGQTFDAFVDAGALR